MLLEEHRTPKSTTECNFISDKGKKKVKGKVKPWLLTQSFAGSYTCRMGSTKISMLSEETQNIILCLEFLPPFEA